MMAADPETHTALPHYRTAWPKKKAPWNKQEEVWFAPLFATGLPPSTQRWLDPGIGGSFLRFNSAESSPAPSRGNHCDDTGGPPSTSSCEENKFVYTKVGTGLTRTTGEKNAFEEENFHTSTCIQVMGTKHMPPTSKYPQGVPPLTLPVDVDFRFTTA